MDPYTEKTKAWLDDRFKRSDEENIYFAHQPIYGFRKGHSEPYLIARYIISYQIMRALAHLQFESLLDVGGAEGYKAALAREIFKTRVRSSDLSAEACQRAKEIFNLEADPVDIQKLPYADNEFEVVMCSETLEHVPDLKAAVHELLRVCKNAVVITIPHEPQEKIEHNLEMDTPHAHIHSFDEGSFDFLRHEGYEVILRKMSSSLLKLPIAFVNAEAREITANRKKLEPLLKIYNCCVPALRKIFGNRTASLLLRLDNFISTASASYRGALFILLKDKNCFSEKPRLQVSPRQILDFTVPYYYLNGGK